MKRQREPASTKATFAVFLQARLGSTRLKEKVLLPLQGKSVIEHAMESLQGCRAPLNVLLTDRESEQRLAPYARRCGFDLFAGASNDVLARFAAAARAFPAERIVRATADNPLVSSELVLSLLELHRRHGADFSGYIGMPLGLGVEVVNASALFIEDREAEDPFEREHVNPFLYQRPDRFRILHPEVPARYRLADCSVTLDTEEDYRYLSRVYRALYEGMSIDTRRLVDWLRLHPRRSEEGGWQPGREGALHSIG